MAAYAALVSVSHVIEQIQQHPRPPITVDQAQIQRLTQNVAFLQDFLECYSNVNEELESRIADAAYAAEDTIESAIVSQIPARSTSPVDLSEVINGMDSIREWVMKIKEETSIQVGVRADSRPADPRRSYPMEHNIMVGLDDELNEVLDRLASHESERQTIPIVGMGGIGKTTLARNVYEHPLVKERFDICAWTTISQEYNKREILREILYQVKKKGRDDYNENNVHLLGDELHKCLFGRRYVIVMDDMWNIEAWENINLFFPNNNEGSRIIVTTRQLTLAHQLRDPYFLQMSFLDTKNSWDLFCKILFGERGCPLELREAGKKITNGCKGLPLSIVVIGGLLAKSEHKREYWEHVAENLNSVVNLEDNERCFNILYMSYSQLPVHLKPCFLYMGVFPEDEVIQVSMLIKLWVAEGFLKPKRGRSMELVAEDYLRDLIDRNLILVHKLGSTDNIKQCNIHDLLRDLCLREAQKERFYEVIKQPSLDHMNNYSTSSVRIVVSECLPSPLIHSAERARSLMCFSGEAPWLHKFRLLRIWKTFDKDLCEGDLDFPRNMSHLVNLRYIAVTAESGSEFCSPVSHFWTLHTLIVNQVWGETGASQIWNMPRLQHVEFDEVELPDPSIDEDDDIILENLQTLLKIRNFRCSAEVVKRIPNVKKLIASYDNLEETSDYFLNNVECLHKLESFGCFFPPRGSSLSQHLTFPRSLKKLTLSNFDWEDMLAKIRSLPHLEKLKLINGFLKQRTWDTHLTWRTVIGEQFASLKFLLIDGCFNMEYWRSESSHFPRLEYLVLRNLDKLKEIPSDVGEIPTLKSIHLEFCSNSAVISAKRILDEQEQQHGDNIVHVRVLLRGRSRIPKSWASANFQVEVIPN
ncbi:hypothetical protein C2S51_008167 [Perilla frutescens var. frutescens]|nr:hypothetical protein C2S51_008167 [Perilla frutescens var. frutescens]